MNTDAFPKEIKNTRFYFVGIKGTGMAALAELLSRLGAKITGSDVADVFYTDSVLQNLGIPFFQGFNREQVPQDAAMVVYSAAYSAHTHPELLRAKELGLPLMTYPEALGAFSRRMPFAGIAGVHGKTTTTALAGTLVRELGLAGSVLAGSAVSNFDGRSTWPGGDDFFIAETCEYRRNFLAFRPRWIILTSVEEDHLDYFKDYADIRGAFLEYCRKLEKKGALIYCADERGACEVAREIQKERPDLRCIPYGRAADGEYRISHVTQKPGATVFRLAGIDTDFEARIPGFHTVLNAAAAAALVQIIQEDLGLPRKPETAALLAKGVSSFRGSKRRSEILGEAGGILFMDDYAHHPTALKTTLAGLRSFYPGRRIVADFMSHTYSRTAALLDGFASSFDDADLLVLHKIYASAREAKTGGVSGKDLFEKVRPLHPAAVYFEEVMDAADYLKSELRPGDLFITLGAGDNWRLGKKLFDELTAARSTEAVS
ncbi:MAG: UDP-N-acetylmuramate--L-alanine ligase [Spirochaetales bacterium]|jgi:UDP-N-acetylmuramate--alanine ligase|nr:UDP-N-acetylmuramate--L-alanine ligase [Spirochaetales bacterium]